MERELVDRLRMLNNSFYEQHASSFSGTRQSPWPGWHRVIDSLQGNVPSSVVDVACGNMRFKTFLETELGSGAFQYCGIDSCVELARFGSGHFVSIDIIDSLITDTICSSLHEFEPDLSVAFGLMHHIPSFELRDRFLNSLVKATLPGGIIAVSFWKFADDEKMLLKAKKATERGRAELGLELEDGDYLLGWQDEQCAYRYCHSFSDEEIDVLVSSVSSFASVVDCYAADGRNGAMNGYAILRRR